MANFRGWPKFALWLIRSRSCFRPVADRITVKGEIGFYAELFLSSTRQEISIIKVVVHKMMVARRERSHFKKDQYKQRNILIVSYGKSLI